MAKDVKLTALLTRKMDESVNYEGRAMYVGEAIIDRLVKLALGGDLDAIKCVYDRLEGKPAQKIEDSAGNRLVIPMIYLPDNARNPELLKLETEDAEEAVVVELPDNGREEN